jgi:hypothetical protein
MRQSVCRILTPFNIDESDRRQVFINSDRFCGTAIFLRVSGSIYSSSANAQRTSVADTCRRSISSSFLDDINVRSELLKRA